MTRTLAYRTATSEYIKVNEHMDTNSVQKYRCRIRGREEDRVSRQCDHTHTHTCTVALETKMYREKGNVIPRPQPRGVTCKTISSRGIHNIS